MGLVGMVIDCCHLLDMMFSGSTYGAKRGGRMAKITKTAKILGRDSCMIFVPCDSVADSLHLAGLGDRWLG